MFSCERHNSVYLKDDFFVTLSVVGGKYDIKKIFLDVKLRLTLRII